ncbi:MAG: M1 family peptidase [Balneolaceae bacterium]|nr:MAG: M1 family peptidase [Balneolaceae bacterium]
MPGGPLIQMRIESRIMTHRLCIVAAVLISSLTLKLSAQPALIIESGGVLTPELASYNVHFYDLDITLNPADSSVSGHVGIHFKVVQPTDRIALALDPRLDIHAVWRMAPERELPLLNKSDSFSSQAEHLSMVTGSGYSDHVQMLPARNPEDEALMQLQVRRSDSSRIFYVHFPETLQPGSRESITVSYSGRPRVAPRAPWDGGMVWKTTPSGDPWVGVAVQTTGAWLWWPNKDHPSDRADSVAISLTMPADLVVASNGRLRSVTNPDKGWKSWHWFVSTPINNYNVTVNAAPYEILSDTYTSIAGDEMELLFWILPEFIEQGRELFPQFAEQLRFMEQIAGPYPFRADKYGVAHAPYLGMEHQTLIAYGANFRNDNLFGRNTGFDDLHQHELAHEWWGNMVTAWDWRDFWIHEGFGTYMQALYAEHLGGMEVYRDMMGLMRLRMRPEADLEVAPRQSMTSVEITRGTRGGDVYYKGAMVLHTLRYYLGDDTFFRVLRRFAYPDPGLEHATDGSPMRFVTTDDFLHLAEQISGRDLHWFFEVYLRQPALPGLIVDRSQELLQLQWEVPGERSFPMPVQIRINGEITTFIPNENGIIALEISDDAHVEIDPYRWLLKKSP